MGRRPDVDGKRGRGVGFFREETALDETCIDLQIPCPSERVIALKLICDGSKQRLSDEMGARREKMLSSPSKSKLRQDPLLSYVEKTTVICSVACQNRLLLGFDRSVRLTALKANSCVALAALVFEGGPEKFSPPHTLSGCEFASASRKAATGSKIEIRSVRDPVPKMRLREEYSAENRKLISANYFVQNFANSKGQFKMSCCIGCQSC